MKEYKKIYNLNTKDLEIIKDLIDMYEKIEQQYKKYCDICESISKNIIYQKYEKENLTPEENCKNIAKLLIEEIKTTEDEYRKKLLMQQKDNIEEQLQLIEKYKPIEKIYTNMYYGNIQEYFEIEREYETETVVYNIKDKLQEKEYYYNKKSTITQIYIRLKYLYNLYIEYFMKKKDINIDFEFLKNNIKFYQIFKNAIKEYIKVNKKNIENTIKSLTETDKKEYIQRTK